MRWPRPAAYATAGTDCSRTPPLRPPRRSKSAPTIASWLAADRSELGSVGTVLDAADYQLLLADLRDVLAAELKAAVRWRLKDIIDFPLEDAVVDVFGIPEPVRRTGAKMMYVIAAKRQAIQDHVATVKAVTPRFDVIDIPELALRNLAAQLPEAESGLILLWLNEQSAQLLVFKGSTLYLARTVQFTQHRRAERKRGGTRCRCNRTGIIGALDELFREPLRAGANRSLDHRAAQ